MCFFRWVLRISLLKKITNEEILGQVEKEEELANEINSRELEYLGVERDYYYY